MNTKDNPGSAYDLLMYLSEKTGISAKIKHIYKSFKDAGFRSNIVYVLNGEELPQLTKTKFKGGIEMLTDANTRTLKIPLDTQFDEIYQMVSRDVKEFGIVIHSAGKYKMCEGGGWYSIQQMCRVDDQYFII